MNTLTEHIPTIDDIEAHGDLARVAKSGICWQTFENWVEAGLLTEGTGYHNIKVRIDRRNNAPMIRQVIFCSRTAVKGLLGRGGRRSRSISDRWVEKGTVHLSNGETLLLACAACRLLRIDRATLLRWSDEDGQGCPFTGKVLNTTIRNLQGQPVVSTRRQGRPMPSNASDGEFTFWFHNEVEEALRARKRFSKSPNGDKVYTREQTSEKTGIPISTLDRRSATDALGLVRVLLPVKSVCTAKNERRGRTIEWKRLHHKVAFTRESVDEYAKTHPNLQKDLQVPAGHMAQAEAAEALNIPPLLVAHWCREGLFRGRSQPHWTSRGERTGFMPTRESVEAAKRILDSVEGDVRKAGKLLRTQCDQRGGHGGDLPDVQGRAAATAMPQVAALPPAASTTAPSASGTHRKGGRPRNPEVEEVQEYLYRRWIKGDKLAAIRAGATTKFGARRAPKEDSHVTESARRYAEKHSLPTNRPA